ncbi:MAG TPA: trehalose-6-phosphate synthase, partial [Bacteroidota bacterium]
MPDRVILVSNRLPVTIRKHESGLEVVPSSGGLATALRSFNAGAGLTWFGWPGVVPRKDRAAVEQALSAHGSVPVFLPARMAERFYEGFSNRTLWPLFHSFASYTRYVEGEWEAYLEANQRFADRVARSAPDDSMIWIHDYQLMLLPSLLREKMPGASIGFFLHVPFPPYEIFRLLPQGREILNALLTADLVGFHTHEYAQAFLGCVRRLLGFENTLGELMVGPRNVQVDVFPIGVDFDSFAQASAAPENRKAVENLKGAAGKLIFSVCRLDYTKGIPQSLAGVE